MKLIINNRDRLNTTRAMVAWGQSAGHEVEILDNASTYPPLLDWYAMRPCMIHRLPNVGPWPHIRNGFSTLGRGKQFVAFSDSDLDLSECGQEMLDVFREQLSDHPHLRKVGCALRIDDLPQTEIASLARRREAEYWTQRIYGEHYLAKIASTLAVYRVGERALKTEDHYGPAMRVAGRCLARHPDWYYEPDTIPEDVRYYVEHIERKGPVFSSAWKKQLRQEAT